MSFYSPLNVTDTVIDKFSINKIRLNLLQTILMGFLGGAYIAIGAQLATIVMANVSDKGIAPVLAGTVFSLGLILVVVAGAELFTGNNLMSMALLSKKISFQAMMKNWIIVFIMNFIGAVSIAFMIYYSGLLFNPDHSLNNAGNRALFVASLKSHLPFMQVFLRAILCNWLVCLAIWMAISALDIISKIFAIIFPIMTFVASGFEHSIANMYFIPIGFLIDKNSVPVTGFLNNILAATLGNIIGGSLFVGTFYYLVYKKEYK